MGHVYVCIAPNDNDEQTKSRITRCVEPKKKMSHQVDDDYFHYQIGFFVVVGKSLHKYLTMRNDLLAFEGYK